MVKPFFVKSSISKRVPNIRIFSVEERLKVVFCSHGVTI